MDSGLEYHERDSVNRMTPVREPFIHSNSALNVKKPAFYSLFFVLALAFLINGLPARHLKSGRPDRWPHGVAYEIFVRSFYDTNGDGIGDLNGVTRKLDYLHWLGVRAIWLMPINPSPSYHGYDVTDYKKINPQYGTLADFKRLIKKAHQLNIKILMDLVVNHTSNRIRWFQNAVKDTTGFYHHFYVWSTDTSVINKDPYHWHKVKGLRQEYYGFFSRVMPDLNYDDPAVRDSIISIGKYWLNKGVDGFRLDAAMYIYPLNQSSKTIAWWKEFRHAMQQVDPDVYLVGEVWTKPTIVARYMPAMGSNFDFWNSFNMIRALNHERADTLVGHLMAIRKLYDRYTRHYNDAVFLTNHDQNRILTQLHGNMNKMRAGISLLMTLPGSPFIYYGEEIGMKGHKPDPHIREPFVWQKGNYTGQCTWEKPVYSTDATVVPEQVQKRQPGSLLNLYRTLIHLRNGSTVLTRGGIDTTGLHSPGLVSFFRMENRDTLLVLHNISNKLIHPDLSGLRRFDKVFFSRGRIKPLSPEKMPAFSTFILKK